MIDVEGAVKALLQTNTSLTALLTGGIYESMLLPADGMNRSNTPSAYSSSPIALKPLCIVRERSAVPTSLMVAENEPLRSLRSNIEIWFYQDKDASISALKTIAGLGYTTLDKNRMSGVKSYSLQYVNKVTGHDPMLNNAFFIRLDFYTIIAEGI